MSLVRIKAMTNLAVPVKPADRFAVSLDTPDSDRSVAFSALLGSMGIAPCLFAAIPAGFAEGMIYVTDGRKVGEGAGAGTGVVCRWNGANWKTVDAGTTVAN